MNVILRDLIFKFWKLEYWYFAFDDESLIPKNRKRIFNNFFWHCDLKQKRLRVGQLLKVRDYRGERIWIKLSKIDWHNQVATGLCKMKTISSKRWSFFKKKKTKTFHFNKVIECDV